MHYPVIAASAPKRSTGRMKYQPILQQQPACMKRRLLFAAAQTYHPEREPTERRVGWIEPPLVLRREGAIGHRATDLALVGRVREGVVVAFRGSLPPFFNGGSDGWTVLLDWLNDALSVCIDTPDYGGGVHLGFAVSTGRLWEDVQERPGIRATIQRLLDRGAADGLSRPHLFLTGHSKGGALANLAAYRAARLPEWRDLPISVATIAAARAGNGDFARAYEAERIACLRYEMPADPVPHLPPGPATPGWVHALANKVAPGLAAADYHPVGVQVSATAGQPPWLTSWLKRATKLFSPQGIGLAWSSPGALFAHAICPQSGYDRLICTGETACGHGH